MTALIVFIADVCLLLIHILYLISVKIVRNITWNVACVSVPFTEAVMKYFADQFIMAY